MKPTDIRIEVKGNPDSSCNVLEYFTQYWMNSTSLHPKMKKVRYFTSSGDVDSLKVIDTDGNVHLSLEDNEALRLDLLSNKLKTLLEL